MFVDLFFFSHIDSANVYKINDRYVSVILKNGSTSLNHYAKQNNIEQIDVKTIYSNKTDQEKVIIDVIIRDPIERYFSGLSTVKKLYNLSDTVPTPEKVERHRYQSGVFLDNHYYPQYLFTVSAFIQSYCSDNLYFRFNDISKLNDIIGNVHLHARSTDEKKINQDVVKKNILKQKYYFDLKIYNHLLGQTVNYFELLDFFQQYMDKEYTGKTGLHMPRWIYYLNQINPKNHVDNYQKEIANYNNVIDNFVNEYNKIKKS